MGAGSGSDDASADTDHQNIGLVETVGAAATPPAADGETQASLGARPVSDKLQRAVARAKIAGKLFANAQEQQIKLGRYHLLEMVGSGGMGVVWGAWDPELDRRVAIKLVKATMQAARDRILLEGQALAKLSHPNVVPVYDVGVVDEQVYLVMEWVRGQNLRAWCKDPRAVRDVVAVYRQCGEGLAAAHGAGLIHRDFKPDNAIRGDDGRVRVLDFGLAREGIKSRDGDDTITPTTPSSDLTKGAGTPRYMPPEQAGGGVLTPAVDQYAFCVSLKEALVGRNADGKDAEVPRWLAELIARGTAHDVKDRFPSMGDLLHALGRDPATIRKRRLLVAGAVAFAGGTFAVGSLLAGDGDVERCVGGKAEIARTWNAGVRDKMVAHLRTLGAYAADEADKIAGELDDGATTWAAMHRDACKARDRGELPPAMYERSLACLDRAKIAIATVAGELTRVDADGVPKGVVAARELPAANRCVDASELASNIDPPQPTIAATAREIDSEVERARVLGVMARPEAVDAVNAAVAKAEALGYPPLVARALLVQGTVLVQTQDVDSILARATSTAFAVGDIPLGVEAFARRLFSTGRWQKPIFDGLWLVESLARGAAPHGKFQLALLHNNVGVAHLAGEDREKARAAFKRAVDVARELEDHNVELMATRLNFALVTPETIERDRLFDEALGAYVKHLGSNHPDTLDGEIMAAAFIDHPTTAATTIREPCERYRRLHPRRVYEIASCTFDLGWLAYERGDLLAARAEFDLISRLETPEPNPNIELGREYLKLLDNKLDVRGIKELEKFGLEFIATDFWWVRQAGTEALLVASHAWASQKRPHDAIRCLAASIPVLEKIASNYPVQRRLARHRATLAVLLATGPVAQTHARNAIEWYRVAGGYDADIARLAAIAR